MNKRLILFIISMLCFTTLTGCGIDRRELVGDIIIGNGYTGIADYLIKYNPAANEFESVVPAFTMKWNIMRISQRYYAISL